ncbi:MAG: hypothetical protein QME61_03600, partial [Patescibacteria group bacterium]|nr:hypothetical protein [Patescibacteria group bacterium]
MEEEIDEIYEMIKRTIVGALIAVVVLGGLIVAGYIFAQIFSAPMVDEVSNPSETGTGVKGVPAIGGVNASVEITKESEAEIEKVDTDGDGMS